jgi:cysteine synthase A
MAKVDWSRHRRYHQSFLDAVGCTPLVQLNKVTRGVNPRVLAKIEWFGPSGSLKDRIYLHMLNKAEARGELRPGMTVLECSTGNAGIACSFVSALKGYRCIVVMPQGMSEERKKMMRAYGTELVFTPGGESDVDLALQKLEEIRRASPDRYWVPGQFTNRDNIEAHYETTAPEIWEQTGGRVDAFVASQGSGGTISGVGKFLHERGATTRVYAVEPAECPILAHRRWGSHGIEGIGDGFVPENLDLGILTGVITTTTAESVAMAQRLAREEGIFCGISSGCNVAAALKLARRRPELENIVVMVNDTGQRYFSTVLCGEKKEVEVPHRDHALDARSVAELDQHQSRWEIIE